MNKCIYVFIRNLQGGGAERVCVNLCNYLIKRGVQVKLVLLENKIEYEIDKDVEIIHLNTINARKSLFKIKSLLANEGIENIFSFNFQISLLLVILRSYSNLEFKIISRHINNLSETFKDGNIWHGTIVPYLLKKMYNKVDCVIGQATNMSDELIKDFNISKEKIFIINNPVSLKLLESRIKPFCSRTKSLLFVGRLSEQKQVDQLIEIFYKCLQLDDSLSLDIYGQGLLEEELRSKVETLGIREKVLFHPFSKNIGNVYSEAKATLLSSKYEGFPNVLIESIACGTPVISYDCPTGPSEIVINGVNGFLIEQNKQDQFVQKILMSINTAIWDQDEIRSTALNYHPDKIGEEYIRVFTEVFGLKKHENR